jgi:hypothetical protein
MPNELIKKTSRFMLENSPSILAGMAIGTGVALPFLVARATRKADAIIFELEDLKQRPLTTEEKIQETWYVYLPTGLALATLTTCVIGSARIQTRRVNALATLYSFTGSALKDYQEKVIELVGRKKHEAIKDAVAEKHISENPHSKAQVVITNNGNTLCYDSLSGRYFESDAEEIRRAQNEMNHFLLTQADITLNEWYMALGLEEIRLGELMGWTSDGPLDIYFTTKKTDKDVPCLVLQYSAQPIRM